MAVFWFLQLAWITVATATSASCNISKHCGLRINVGWWSIAPYIYKDNGNVTGIFPTLLSKMASTCCGECTQIVYESPHDSESNVLSELKDNISIYLPIYGSVQDVKKYQNPYLPIIESPGVVYLTNVKDDITAVSADLIKAILRAWPIMCFLLMGAAVSGVIVWALDCYCNPAQFPVNFFKGSWDGFWWACVSMTTVGYGDRAPKSLSARIFAFIWVLTGVVTIAGFNGSITAQLTGLVMSNKLLQGEQVTVIDNTAEKKYGLSLNINITVAKDVSDLKNKLMHDDTIKGAILDSYVAGFHRDFFSKNNKIRIADVLDHTYAYGMLLHQATKSSKLQQCFLQYLSVNQKEVIGVVELFTKALQLPEKSISQSKSENILNPSNSWFLRLLAVCSGLILFFVLVGMIWQYNHRRRHVQKYQPVNVNLQEDISMEELLKKQCLEFETAMEEEVEQFFKRWIAQKKSICKYDFCFSATEKFESFENGNVAKDTPIPTYIP